MVSQNLYPGPNLGKKYVWLSDLVPSHKTIKVYFVVKKGLSSGEVLNALFQVKSALFIQIRR